MTVRTRSELNSDADTNLADNTSGDISAADVRASVKNLADSAVLPADSPNLTAIELGHATDTTISRGAAGFIAVEGKRVPSPASQASGDLLYRGATEWERLAKGTASQVLRMNAGATAPEWATAAASGWDMTGQTWQSVTRVDGTQYQNTTGKPIVVSAYMTTGSNGTAEAEVKMNTISGTSGEIIIAYHRTTAPSGGSAAVAVSAVIPPNYYYRLAYNGTTGEFVRELR